MLPGGCPLPQSGGENHKWPTCGQGGYITPAALGIIPASEQGTELEVAHLWARWLHNPCRLEGPHRLRAGGSIRSGPFVGKVATQPLPPWRFPPIESRGQNQKWPTSGQGGYKTPPAYEIPSDSRRGADTEMARLWARWLHNPCRLGDPLRFRAGGRITSGPLVGKVAT